MFYLLILTTYLTYCLYTHIDFLYNYFMDVYEEASDQFYHDEFLYWSKKYNVAIEHANANYGKDETDDMLRYMYYVFGKSRKYTKADMHMHLNIIWRNHYKLVRETKKYYMRHINNVDVTNQMTELCHKCSRNIMLSYMVLLGIVCENILTALQWIARDVWNGILDYIMAPRKQRNLQDSSHIDHNPTPTKPM